VAVHAHYDRSVPVSTLLPILQERYCCCALSPNCKRPLMDTEEVLQMNLVGGTGFEPVTPGYLTAARAAPLATVQLRTEDIVNGF
jgi:hypothetical protein